MLFVVYLQSMIDEITIRGFKSIKSQCVSLGSMNILIGGNGIGKTNFISAFELMRDIYEQQLQSYVLRKGGANGLLYNGKKYTRSIELALKFTHEGNHNKYSLILGEAQDTLYVKEEESGYMYPDGWSWQTYAANEKESQIKNTRVRQAKYVKPLLEQFEIYHFHDTGDTSPMKRFADLHDNRRLRRDGSNIAPFLYWMKEKHPNHFRRIEIMVKTVSPFFESFVLEPNRLNSDTIRLEWKQQGVDDVLFNANQLSDGSLRFVCLAALLMQPEPPSTILIDEPELGLHPLAINKLCSLLKKASACSQIIVSTQSVGIVDNFTPNEIIVADRENDASVFNHLSEDNLKSWLKDYSLGELWEKNVIGGQPF